MTSIKFRLMGVYLSLYMSVVFAQTVEDACYTEYETTFLDPFGPCLSYNILEACVNDTLKDETDLISIADSQNRLASKKLSNCSSASYPNGYVVRYSEDRPIAAGSNGLSKGETAGLVIGLLLVVLLVLIAVFAYKSKRPRGRKISPKEVSAMESSQGAMVADSVGGESNTDGPPDDMPPLDLPKLKDPTHERPIYDTASGRDTLDNTYDYADSSEIRAEP
eukprot:m.101541 g.101541  ORF g.101541 m.101541 type:complete len:221 (-) comp16807_c0_seq2:330-992(-)